MPVLYTVLTTICAFMSLIFSGIKPIIDFGWMMTLGLLVSLAVTFLLLPSLLNIFSKENEILLKNNFKSIITSMFASIAKKIHTSLIVVTILIIIVSFIGISKLEVENNFINYFDKETEIYQGMKKIDDELGGTTPLNIILKFLKRKQMKLMMSFPNGKKTMKMMRINQSIGLQETKWIKL